VYKRILLDIERSFSYLPSASHLDSVKVRRSNAVGWCFIPSGRSAYFIAVYYASSSSESFCIPGSNVPDRLGAHASSVRDRDP
jgi:hypothetical protein